MSLADDLAELPQSYTKATGCSVCYWLSTIDERDRDAVTDRIKAGDNRARLARICQSWGLAVKVGAFQRHCRECVA